MCLADLVPLHRAWHLHLQLTRRYGRSVTMAPPSRSAPLQLH
jgi:hypothetical protein